MDKEDWTKKPVRRTEKKTQQEKEEEDEDEENEEEEDVSPSLSELLDVLKLWGQRSV